MPCLAKDYPSHRLMGKGGHRQSPQGLLAIFGKHALPAAAINIWLISKQRFFRQGWDKFFIRLGGEGRPFWRLVSGGLTVALGLSRALPFGLSVKAIDKPPSPDLLPSFLSPHEFKHMVCRGLLADIPHLWALWSAKEAFLNLLGYRFALPPSKVEIVSLDPLIIRRADGKKEEFSLKQIRLYLGGCPYLLTLVRPPQAHPRPVFGIKIWPGLKETFDPAS